MEIGDLVLAKVLRISGVACNRVQMLKKVRLVGSHKQKVSGLLIFPYFAVSSLKGTNAQEGEAGGITQKQKVSGLLIFPYFAVSRTFDLGTSKTYYRPSFESITLKDMGMKKAKRSKNFYMNIMSRRKLWRPKNFSPSVVAFLLIL